MPVMPPLRFRRRKENHEGAKDSKEDTKRNGRKQAQKTQKGDAASSSDGVDGPGCVRDRQSRSGQDLLARLPPGEPAGTVHP
jgi:hypothetical protein